MAAVSKDHYYRLASEIWAERLQAAKQLLEELIEVDSVQEYKYALNRLIVGLSSSRAGARIGFSTCLAELLSILIQTKDYSIHQYLQDLETKLRETTSKGRGKDERSYLFGKVFGLQALLESSLFDQNQDSLILLNVDEFIDILCQLLDISLLKSWIREVCHGSVIKSLLNQKIIPDVMSNDLNIKIMKLILRKLDETNLTFTTEGLMIYLSILPSQRFQIVMDSKLNNNSWKDGNPLARGNIPLLIKVLKDSSTIDDDGNFTQQQKGSWQSNLHSVWDLLINELLSSSNLLDNDYDDDEEIKEDNEKKRSKHSHTKKSKKSKNLDDDCSTIKFNDFWKAIIDDQFFSSSASVERKFIGFLILQKTLCKIIDPKLISIILSPNLMRSLINQTGKNDRFLNKMGKQILDELVKLSLQNVKFRIPLLKVLLKSEYGNIHFDNLTKSKTCELIITQNPNLERDELLQFFIDWFNQLNKNDDLKKLQNFILDEILLIFKSTLSDNRIQLFHKLCQLFVKFGFFIPIDQDVDDDNSVYNNRLSQLCHERLNSLLTLSSSSSSSGSNIKFSDVIDILQILEKNPDYKLRLELDDELNEIKQNAIIILNQIKNLSFENKKMKCFETLYSMILIQVYSGDEDSISLIPELNMAYEKQFSNDDDDTSDQSNEILMDILLTFISQKSVLMKQLAFIIWEFLIENDGVNLKNINHLNEILTTRENKEGQLKLFGDDDDDEELDHHSHSEDNEELDHHSHSEDNEDSSSDDDDDDDDDNNDDDLNDVDIKTNVALAQAFGIPTSESGEVKFNDLSSSDDDDESDVESMSDEQMLAIEDQLSAIFQQRKNAMNDIKLKSGNQRKLDVLDAKQNMIFFKNRIVDLISRFNELSNSSHLNLYFIPLLLDLIQLTLDKSLGEKVHKFLKLKFCKSKIIINNEISKEKLLEMINDIHSRASNSSIKAHTLACNQCSLFIAKILLNNFKNDDDDDVLDSIIDVYANSMKLWSHDKNSKIQSTMFFDFVNWINSRRN